MEVPNHYVVSQYDHTVDYYIKKKLSDKFYQLLMKSLDCLLMKILAQIKLCS